METTRQRAAAGACALIRPDAMAHNVQQLRDKLVAASTGRPPSIWAVIKAEAYGHGVAHALAGLTHADGLAVGLLADVYRLRAMGYQKPVLVINSGCGVDLEQLSDPELYPLHLVIDVEAQIDRLERSEQMARLHVWLRYSGVLHHAGFHRPAYARAWHRLQNLRRTGRLAGVGHLQHYANSEDMQPLLQERLGFESMVGDLPGIRCTENSAALLADPDYARTGDWVRSGIALYGISPLDGVVGAELGLQPAMELQAPIFATQTLAAGQSLGYGLAFRSDRDMRVGLVACGYADGYPRNIAPDCPVLINGRLSRIIGRVSMDMLTVDLNDHPDATVGTIVTLWGATELPIERIARCAGTIPAQLCSSVMERVPRLTPLTVGSLPTVPK